MLSQNQVVKVKAALEKGYIGTFTVIEHERITDPDTHITDFQDVVTVENQPCRLSFSSIPTTGSGDPVSVTQGVKLFFDPSITVKAGSKVIVTQNGVTTNYMRSGEPAIYDTHIEINLELFDGWA